LEFNRITRELGRAGRVEKIDLAVLASYCSAWATYVEAENKLASMGLLVKTKSGNIIQNPYLGARNTALRWIQKLAHELGFSPGARGQTASVGKGATTRNIIEELEEEE